MTTQLPTVVENRRFRAPAVTPQALAWHNGVLWLGSRDQKRVYGINVQTGQVIEENEAPGIPWAAISTGNELRFTIGEGSEDDRYIWTYTPGTGFSDRGRFACPDFTGSYLSYDGTKLHLSQWYKGRILTLEPNGEITGEIVVGAEISGHVYANGKLYVLRGTEKDGESWTIATVNSSEGKTEVRELATVPFACRSLTFDGENFWSNYRSASETISFSLPG